MNPEKRYGLIIPKKENAEKKKFGLASVFGDDSSDSDKDTSTDWKKKALQAEQRKGVKKQTKLEMERALAEDPTVYQYDEIYDEIDKKKADKVAAKKREDKKPRYIQSLLKQAERRKQENERRNERQVQLEREKEGAEFADKETFVTSSYRKKLEEFKKQDEEERRMDMLEEIGDVSKQQDLGGFYRHLYQTTVAEDEHKDKKKKQATEGNEKLTKKHEENLKKSEGITIKTEEISPETIKSGSKKLEKQSGRSYRKRARSESSDEEEKGRREKRRESKRHVDDVPEEKKKDGSGSEKEMTKEENLDADTSQSSSSEDDGSEEGEIIDKKEKKVKQKESKHKEVKPDDKGDAPCELNLEDKVKSSLDKILEEKKRHLEKLIREEEEKENEKEEEEKEGDEKEEKKEEEKEKKKKINIWEKRTVGAVFDAAYQRYLERKANREATQG